MSQNDLNLWISAAVLLGTVVLIVLTAWMLKTKKPNMRLDQLRVTVHKPFGGWATTGDSTPVALVFVNDGPGIAPGLRAFVKGVMPGDEREFQFPPSGSPTVAVGERFEIELHLVMIEKPDKLQWRKYVFGDDFFFDLADVGVRFEWLVRGKWKKKTVSNLHSLQQDASPQVAPIPLDWTAEHNPPRVN